MKSDPDILDAIELGDLDSVKLYWTDQIEINHQDFIGRTMLMLAASYGFVEIVEYLLGHHPDPTLANTSGETALEIARRRGNKLVVGILSDYLNDWKRG